MLSVLKQRFEVVITVTVQFTMFLDIQPRSLVDISGSFKETYCLHLAGRSFFTLVMEAAYSCGTLAVLYQTTRRNSPEESNLQLYR